MDTDKNKLTAAAGVDAAGLQQAKHGVESAAKGLAKAAKAATEAAEQLQMEAVNAAPEFEDGLLLDPVAMRKRYTAQHAQENELRRDTCLYLLSRCAPVEDIMRLLRMNYRTVTALAQLNAEQLAALDADYSEWLKRGSAKAFAHAITKLPEANALQAATVGGIMADKALAIKGGIPAGAGEEPAIDVTAEDADVKKFREDLKKLKSANQRDAGPNPTEEKP